MEEIPQVIEITVANSRQANIIIGLLTNMEDDWDHGQYDEF